MEDVLSLALAKCCRFAAIAGRFRYRVNDGGASDTVGIWVWKLIKGDSYTQECGCGWDSGAVCCSVMGPFSLAIFRATGSMAPPATKKTCIIYFEYIFNSRSILLWTPIKRNSSTIQPVLNKRERIGTTCI